MKKLFFCLFSTIFIAICLWLGMYGETYAYYTNDNMEHRLNDIEFQNVPNFTDILSALENYSFEDNNQVSYCTYNEIFSSYYYIKVDPSASYYNRVFIYFSLADTLNTDTNSLFTDNGVTYNRYLYTFNSTPCLSCVYDLDNNSNYILKLYYRYNASNSNTTDLLFMPKYQVNSTFNDGYKQVFSNCELTYNNSIIENVEQAPVEPPNDDEQGGYGGFFETIIGVITDEYNAVVDFFTNLPQIFMHMLIPSKEEYEDLTERFSDQITDRFLIIPLTRNGESYDNTDKYAFIGGNKPHLLIYGYDFDMNELYTALRTPINFGYVQDSNVQSFWYKVDNSSVTPYFIINFVIMVNFIAMNMALYNKFFDKE